MADKQEAPRALTGRGIAPLDIQQKEFRVSRFGGYRMRDVDEFLDEVTSSLQSALSENERLRAQAAAAPVVGEPDLDDVSRQADEIIERARDEAARIVADAKERAASVAGTSATAVTSDQERAAVHAFLAQEREFLQSLAALVQGHAESVKTMARASRSGPPPTAATSVTSGATPSDAPAEARPAAQPAPKPTAKPAPKPTAPVDPEATQVVAKPTHSGDERPEDRDEDRTIRVDEPQPAAAKTEGDADTSLRELFWGEEG